MSYKVLIADGLASEGKAKLAAIPGIEVLDKNGISREELRETLKNVQILIVRSRTTADRELLSWAPKLQLVLRAGIGLDNVDIEAATERGVIVMNAPTGNIVTTAEHTLALLFAVSRRVPQADASMKAGKWDKKKFQGSELNGKTLGLIGLGNIGRTVATRAVGLGMKVIGHDPYLSEEKAAQYQIRLAELDTLLRQSDYVSVHVPLTKATTHLLDRDALAKMKKGAYLINCARGGIVDEMALVEALESGHLSGAALDVFEEEPPPADHPLLKRDDVVVTPHLGASTDEAQVQVGLEVAEQIGQFVERGALKNAINAPNLSLEQLELLNPYLKLAERLSSFTAQISHPKNIKKLVVQYSGEFPSDPSALTLSVVKGFLSPLLSTPVNLVNARGLLKERGIQLEESFVEDSHDYGNLISLTVEGERKLTCRGTIFGKEEPRIVRIDDFVIDAVPSGHLLFTRNTDQPGVVGALGSALAEQGVNIARMHLGRDREKGQAIAVISVDSELKADALVALRKLPGMLSAEQITL